MRPEALELANEGLDAGVEAVEELGLDAYVFCTAELPGGPARLVARIDTRHAPARGERVRAAAEPGLRAARVRRADAGERL